MNAGQISGQEWISFEEHRDAANNKTKEIYKYYGATPEQERTVEREWDFDGQPWTRIELTRNHQLKETLKETWFDNGTHSVKVWNWSGQGWEWFETLYNGSTRLTEAGMTSSGVAGFDQQLIGLLAIHAQLDPTGDVAAERDRDDGDRCLLITANDCEREDSLIASLYRETLNGLTIGLRGRG